MSAPLFERRHVETGGMLAVARNDVLAEAVGVAPGLVVTLGQPPVMVARFLTREDVRELAQVLDDWLFDSRPT
jgi:uncharacterized membrane protein (DUF4010 family)